MIKALALGVMAVMPFIIQAKDDTKTTITFLSDAIQKNGELLENDPASLVLNQLKDVLSDKMYIDYQNVNRQREWTELADNKNACLFNKFKTAERELKGSYSAYPINEFPPNRLLTYDRSDIPNSVSLLSAISHHDLKIGVVKGRSYGQDIDRIIAAHPDNFIQLTGNKSAVRLRKMMINRRIDSILEYSIIFIQDYENDKRIENIRYHELKEATEFSFGYIVCSKSETGERALELFNKTLAEQNMQDFIIQAHLKYLPQSEYALLKKALSEKFKHKLIHNGKACHLSLTASELYTQLEPASQAFALSARNYSSTIVEE